MERERGILHHLGFLTAAQVVSQLLNVWALVFLAGFLGPHDFGIVQVGVAFLAYALLIAEWGMMSLGVRDLARLDEAPSRLSYARTQTGLLAVQAAVVLAAGWLVLPLLPFTSSDPWIFRLYLLAVVPQVFHFWWIAAGRERMDWVGANRTALSLVYALAVLLLVPRLDGAGGIEARRWVPIAWLTAFTAGNVLLFAPVRRLVGGAVLPTFPAAAEMRRRWRETAPIGAATVVLRVLLNVDLLLLGVMAAPAVAGQYAAASRLMFLVVVAVEVLWNALLPRMSRLFAVSRGRYRAEFNRWLGLLLAAALPAALAAALLGPRLVAVLLGGVYGTAGQVLRVLSASYLCLAISFFLGRALIAEDRQDRHLKPLALGAIVAVAAVAILVPRFGAPGAAWGMLAAHSVLLALLVRLHVENFRRELGALALGLLPALVFFAAAVKLTEGRHIAVPAGLGAAAYAAAAWVPVRRLLRRTGTADSPGL